MELISSQQATIIPSPTRAPSCLGVNTQQLIFPCRSQNLSPTRCLWTPTKPPKQPETPEAGVILQVVNSLLLSLPLLASGPPQPGVPSHEVESHLAARRVNNL